MNEISRRQFFNRALIGAAAFAVPTSANDIIFTPGNGVQLTGPSSRLLDRAKAAMQIHSPRVRNSEIVAIADFSRPSRDPRFRIVNLHSGKSTSVLVAHGKGSDPGHSGWVQSFSNVPGSEATSSGSYLVGEGYFGEHGASRRLAGLDPENDQAASRAIVIHPAWYVSRDMAADRGKIGRSQGCFAFAQNDIEQILSKLTPGTLLFADKA
ncbi:MAG: murein L,D-transpeptidase catalytic domain family protein [Sphingorhabdus sp.]